MGFLDYGLAAKAFADGFRQTYITDAEREKERMAIEEAEMQNQIRQAQLAALAKEQANDEAWKKSFTNPILGDIRPPVPQMQGSVGQGLLAIQPNPEFNQPTRDVTNLMGLLQQNASPYEQAIIQGLPNMSAKEGATLLSSILKNREDNTTKENYYNLRREMDDWRRDQAEKTFGLREKEQDRREREQDRKERADQNKAVLNALRANRKSGSESTYKDLVNQKKEAEKNRINLLKEYNNISMNPKAKAFIEQQLTDNANEIAYLNSKLKGDQPTPKPVETMPDAAKYSGRVIRDTVTGDRFKSNGKQWVKM
jgi:hypothetical protein